MNLQPVTVYVRVMLELRLEQTHIYNGTGAPGVPLHAVHTHQHPVPNKQGHPEKDVPAATDAFVSQEYKTN